MPKLLLSLLDSVAKWKATLRRVPNNRKYKVAACVLLLAWPYLMISGAFLMNWQNQRQIDAFVGLAESSGGLRAMKAANLDEKDIAKQQSRADAAYEKLVAVSHENYQIGFPVVCLFFLIAAATAHVAIRLYKIDREPHRGGL